MVTFTTFYPFLRTPRSSRRCWPPLAVHELHQPVMLLLFMFLCKSLLRDPESSLSCQFGKDGKRLSESIPVVVKCKVRRDPEKRFGYHVAFAIKTA